MKSGDIVYFRGGRDPLALEITDTGVHLVSWFDADGNKKRFEAPPSDLCSEPAEVVSVNAAISDANGYSLPEASAAVESQAEAPPDGVTDQESRDKEYWLRMAALEDGVIDVSAGLPGQLPEPSTVVESVEPNPDEI